MRVRRFERRDRSVQAAGIVRDPAKRAEASLVIRRHDRPPDRPAHGLFPRRSTGDLDRLLVSIERPPAIRRAIAIRIGWIDFEQDDVAPVALRVGEAPRDVCVAADDHRGNTRKRDADQAMGRRVGSVLPLERRAIPRVRHSHGQVHVVGEQGASIVGEPARDRPVVAANGAIAVNCPSPNFSNSRRGVPTSQEPIDQAERSVGLLLDRAGAGCRVLRFFALRRALTGATRPQIVDIGSRNRGHVVYASDDRRVPLRAHGREEVRHRLRQHVMHRPQRGLVRPIGILQCDEHREDDEHRILDEPFARFLPKHRVLERRLSQSAQAAVHTRGVGLEDGSPFRIHRGERALRFRPETVDADVTVGDERAWPDQRGQFPRCSTSGEIHLEEAILRVQEPGGARDVQTGGAPDRRDAERVARDHDWRREPFESKLAAERRQAASQLRPRPHDGRSCAYGQQDRDGEPYYPQSATHRGDYGDYGLRPLF